MKYFLKGTGSVELGPATFAADGGEGKIYVKNGVAYKIYHEASHCISESKIRELSLISNPNIIRPQDILLNQRGEPIGYSMRYITDTYLLCQLFPKSFRVRNGLTPDKTLQIVEEMSRGIADLHRQNILIVDINENNFLVSKDFKEVNFIDVDSYQTQSFNASALSEMVRDRHGKLGEFNEGTDWFSFAVVGFQLFRGIHPYRGKYPGCDTLDARMIHNISVMHKGVSYPHGAVLDESVIPVIWQDWFLKVLEKGERLAPPTHYASTAGCFPFGGTNHITGVGLFDHIELFQFTYSGIASEVLSLHRSGTHLIAVTKDKVYVDRGRSYDYTGEIAVGFLPKLDTPFSANLVGGKIVVRNLLTGDILPCNIGAEALMSYEGKVYYKAGASLLVIDPIVMSGRTVLAGKVLYSVLENASTLYQGCLIQNMLGSWYVTLPSGAQIGLKELKTYKVVDARYDGGVLMVVGSKNNIYDRFIFRISNGSYSSRKIENISYSGLNFVTLDNGICVSMTELDEIEIFSNNPAKNEIKLLTDTSMGGIVLLKDGVAIVVFKTAEGKFYQLKTK